jgi:hypothetical protein
MLTCNHFRFVVLFFALNAGIEVPAFAQNYAVNWHAITGGGGVSSNAPYAITGTVGQPCVARSQGGRYAIDSGFWAYAAAIQTPGAPVLTIYRSSTNTVTISWPSPGAGFVLQSTTDLTAAQWSVVIASSTDDGVMKSVVVSLASGNQFFRLMKAGP